MGKISDKTLYPDLNPAKPLDYMPVTDSNTGLTKTVTIQSVVNNVNVAPPQTRAEVLELRDNGDLVQGARYVISDAGTAPIGPTEILVSAIADNLLGSIVNKTDDNENVYTYDIDTNLLEVQPISAIAEPPTSDKYLRTNGNWVLDPIQIDAPANDIGHVRKNNAWAEEAIPTDAAEDGKQYTRINNTWTENSASGTAYTNDPNWPNNPTNVQTAFDGVKSYIDSSVGGTARYRGLLNNNDDIRSFVPILQGDYWKGNEVGNVITEDGTIAIAVGTDVIARVDMTLTTDCLTANFDVISVQSVPEAPIDGGRYARKDAAWEFLPDEQEVIPFNDPNVDQMDFTSVLGQAYGTSVNPTTVAQFSVNLANSKLGGRVRLWSNRADAPTYDGQDAVNVVVIGGQYVPNVTQAISLEYFGNGEIRLLYETPVPEDPSAIITTINSGAYIADADDNGVVLDVTFAADSEITLPDGLVQGAQFTVINRTNNAVVSFAVQTGSLIAEGTQLATVNTAAHCIHLGGNVWFVGGKLTTP